MNKLMKYGTQAKALWLSLCLLAFGAIAGAAHAQTTDFSGLVSGAEEQITAMKSPVSTILVDLLVLAAIVGIGLWILGMVRRKH